MSYLLPLLASRLWRAMNLVSLMSFHDVSLLNQAPPPSLHHVRTDRQVSVRPQHPSSTIERGGHVQREPQTVGVCGGSVAGHGWEVEGVVAGGQAERLQQGGSLRIRAWTCGQSWAMLLPAFPVHWGWMENMVPGRAAATHRLHARVHIDCWTLGPSSWGSEWPRTIVVICQRLRADRTGALFQHGGKAARGLSIVLQGGISRQADSNAAQWSSTSSVSVGKRNGLVCCTTIHYRMCWLSFLPAQTFHSLSLKPIWEFCSSAAGALFDSKRDGGSIYSCPQVAQGELIKQTRLKIFQTTFTIRTTGVLRLERLHLCARMVFSALKLFFLL